MLVVLRPALAVRRARIVGTPMGPEYCSESSTRCAGTGSTCEETGRGRLCGESARSAPRDTTEETSSACSCSSTSSQNLFQRSDGSGPSTATISGPRGGVIRCRRVSGQSTTRSPSSVVRISGRLTWKSMNSSASTAPTGREGHTSRRCSITPVAASPASFHPLKAVMAIRLITPS